MRSSDYIEGFVTTCLENGLTKEATGKLLQADLFLAQCDAEQRRGAIEVIKSARFLRSIGRALPYVGATGAGAFGLHAVNNIFGSQRPTNFPMANTAFDATAAQNRFYDELDEASQGIISLNKAIQIDPKREAELQQAVDAGAPGSERAMLELDNLRGGRDHAQKQRDKYLASISADATEADMRAQGARERLGRVGSWWGDLPATFGIPRSWRSEEGRNALDDRLRQRRLALQQDYATQAGAAKLLTEQARRLHGGYTGGLSRPQPAPQQFQHQFFNTAQ